MRKALYDYDRQQYNTVASACMGIVNTLGRLGESEDERAVLHEGVGVVLRLLAPITPHVTHVLWHDLGFGANVLDGGWPAVDPPPWPRTLWSTSSRSTASCAVVCPCRREPTSLRSSGRPSPGRQHPALRRGRDGAQGDRRAGQARQHRGEMTAGQGPGILPALARPTTTDICGVDNVLNHPGN